jgi:predicted Rossmann fold flavoprotein
MSNRKIIIIGAGASGLMAAGQAASLGADVTLIEKMPRPARKLRITGKGRCNITNTAELDDFISHFGKNGNFLRQAFSRFFVPDLLDFLKTLGVHTVVERGGRVFPRSDDAVEVVDALVNWAKHSGVSLLTNSPVENLIVENKSVIGVIVGGKKIPADAVIIATGGASYAATGSTGDGYRIAESVGHKIIPIRPALVPLETKGDIAPRLQGLSLKNVSLKVFFDDKKVVEEFGEMLFTHFGVSGPIVLTVSKTVVDALHEKKKVTLSIDLKPALDADALDARLRRDIESHGKRQFQTLLKELLPATLIPVCIDLNKIPPDKTCSQITADERKRLKSWLKDFPLEVTKSRPLDEAIITAGGFDTREINPRTMESRLIKGLYFAGEVLDIDADTGGYNLQAAFSTGWLAGNSVI